jgi:hypothetical protein
VLNLALPEVQEFIIKSISDILNSADITYVKWDNNRGMHEMPSPATDHAYMLGMYHVFDTLTSNFPTSSGKAVPQVVAVSTRAFCNTSHRFGHRTTPTPSSALPSNLVLHSPTRPAQWVLTSPPFRTNKLAVQFQLRSGDTSQ